MKTRKLRLVSALLAVAMMLALLPTAAFAEDNHNCGATSADNVTWKLENNTLTISGSGKMADYANADKQPWAGQRDNIKHLVVENGVTTIGNNAFCDCTKLESVDLSNASSLTTIKTSFWGCRGLNSVELNEGLKEIGGSSFSFCTSLKSIHIPSTVENIGSWCFQRCTSLSEVTFADGINLTTIKGATFIYCYSLKKITIPKSVKMILRDNNFDGAFKGCRGLESVIFEPGSSLETVDEYTFDFCNNLQTVYYDGDNATAKAALQSAVGEKFQDAWRVTFDTVDGSAVTPQNVKNGQTATKPTAPTKKEYDFAGWYIKDADGKWAAKPFDFDTTITENITLYAKWTPGGNCGDNLTWILDDNGTLTISGSGEMADYDENNQPWADYKGDIKHLVVENGVTSIGNNAFRDCTKLIDADMSKALSLSSISTSFWGCSELNNVKLNEGLKEIGGSAFSKCTSLKSIDIPSTVEKIGSWCFQECGGLENVTFAKGSQLKTIAEATFAGCKILETITIPKKVKEIRNDAFNGCRGLKSVTFEPGSELETIGDVAFQDTAISEISIPASVKTIGRYAFNECLNLTKVIFESPSKLDTVDENAFKGCSATIYYSDETAKKH